MTVAVVGEALIDVSEDTRSVPPLTREYVGGSPANVALGIARLGHAVALQTWIADDPRGRRIAEHLGSSGVEVLRSSWGARRTPTSVARLGPSGAADYTFDLEWSVPVPNPQLAARSVDILHTGSIASYLDPGYAGVLSSMSDARERGALVTYDPNVRRALIHDDAAVRERILTAASFAHVVKLSDEDAEWLFRDGVDSATSQLLRLGAELVAVTLGGRGSTLSTRTATLTVPAASVAVVDTIGAGDSYMAALIAALVEREVDIAEWTEIELEAIGAHCARAAGITVSRAGANPPTSAELLVS